MISLLLQLLSYFLEIVYLAIEVYNKIPKMHRLMTKRGKVQDGQPPLAKSYYSPARIIYLMPAVIRPPVNHSVRHPSQQVHITGLLIIEETRYSTHNLSVKGYTMIELP